jgi:hypothetical protein
MIVIRIKGGLGNQLFQYASAMGLATSSGRSLKIDRYSGFGKDGVYLRKYRLDRVGVSRPCAGIHEVCYARLVSLRHWLNLRKVESVAMVERGEFFEPLVVQEASSQPILYLEGYLQSPRYFSSIEAEVRKELTWFARGTDTALGSSPVTKCINSVSLHVRRRDYARVLAPDYYRNAVELIKKHVRSPHFYVFGDDPAWVSSQLNWLDPKTVMRNAGPDNDLSDLELMASCHHHIIANSTFSWWGSWLSSEQGLTIAPAAGWTSAKVIPRDLFPDSWIVI